LKACRAGFVPAGKARLNTGAAGVERVEARDQVSGAQRPVRATVVDPMLKSGATGGALKR